MRITEKRLRSIIRNVIRESVHDDDIFRPFDQDESSDYDDLDIIDADGVSQLDQPAPQRRDLDPVHQARNRTREFMTRNRRAGEYRDRGSYAMRGSIHDDQLDMLNDMDDEYDY